ncbi:MAG: D-alanyl-D-alanine carboxypeptidase [Flavobacteriaceae bacterium]|nr:D-alanyl-D-alanine carboxypeptidase [Flavobacteriaceae bacterium]
MNRSLLVILLIAGSILFVSCGTSGSIKNELVRANKDNNYFRGFVLYDPLKKKELINVNGNKYFTPASNTKLYTFYTAYKALGDSIKSLEYVKKEDSLIIRGTADPSFFYGFDSTKVLNLLTRDTAKIYLLDAKIDDPAYGSGWAWDDYMYDYQPEKNLFPIYGNLTTYFIDNDSILSEPSYFKDRIFFADSLTVVRAGTENSFYVQKHDSSTYKVPFISSNTLTASLLEGITGRTVTVIPDTTRYNLKGLYAVPADSLYKQMLVISDNFIAEQLLLQVAGKVSGRYKAKNAILYSLENYLADLPQKPRWVDGSGLSRYNLFTPEDMVHLLKKMYIEIPREKLLNYFPAGGVSGTLKNWYGNDRPYIYAKSGSLSNNYNLSGYLITKKGNILIFSYMNNHYEITTSKLKKGMEELFLRIYNHY